MRDKKHYVINQPPRSVPLSVRLRILLGGFMNQFGWLFLGFGLIFVWIFALNSEMKYYFHFRGQLQTAVGKILEIRATGTIVNNRRVCEYRYHFDVDGRRYEDFSYSTDSRVKNGSEVVVEYGDPEVSRIQGMSKAIFPAWIVPITIIFPLVGFGLILGGLKKGLHGIYLLTNGEVGKGRIKSKEPTTVRINGRVVYRLTFEMIAPDGKTYETVTKTHTPEYLEDQEEECLLFDPFDPACAEMMDNLPGFPEIDENGFIKPKSWGITFWVILAPALTIVGHGTFLYLKFGGGLQ